ncbi:MAG: 3D domain-containing protein [Clostridium sp.]|nr:3D domain-containing protein [Clostridium sp.]
MKRRLSRKVSAAMFCAVFSLGTSLVSFADETADAAGPASEVAAFAEAGSSNIIKEGEFLGDFEVTAYCGCQKCSKGNALTYSGNTPKEGHTISADLDVFPLGTRLLIDGTVYTVEDTGSGIDGNHLDIYFDSHEKALDYGRQTEEVYAAES